MESVSVLTSSGEHMDSTKMVEGSGSFGSHPGLFVKPKEMGVEVV